MPRTRPPYREEFREQIVSLARSGRSAGELSAEFEASHQTICNWIRQADLDDGIRTDGLTTEERKELRRLKKEVRRLRQERDILEKAASWFARETDAIPEKSTG